MNGSALDPQAAWVRRQLLRWFERHARDLPWRRGRDPYTIWVSEVMLQQTQVASVIPFFERFIHAFPSLESLAQADESAVLRAWEGLGFYRRARDLHRAARLVHADHHGELPDDPDQLQQLPGFGRYTANAVLSQAFDRRLPILEANSRRVLCRLYAVRGDPRRPDVQAQLWSIAEALLPRKRVGALNQSLMELGALVCTPRKPHCETCPLTRQCQARRAGLQESIPIRARRAKTVHADETAIVLARDDRVLLVRRPDGGRWAGLWEFPHLEQEPLESPADAGRRLLDLLGLAGKIERELATIRHSVTRFSITLTCLHASWRRGEFSAGVYPEGRWLSLGELAGYPISAPQRRLTKNLCEPPA
jgi:A/G-specific adenine glycosylase